MNNIKNIARSRIAYHILFWVLAFVFWLFTMFVASSFENVVKLEPVLMTLIFNFCFATAVYFNLWVLIPRLFKKQKFFLYAIGLFLTISVAAFFIDFLLVYPLRSFVQGEQYFQKLTFFVWFNFAFFTFIYVGVTSFLSLMREWFVLQKISFQLKDIEREKLEAELKALKSQINPHFLFNTLNNIYSLTLDKSDKAPDLVLKLSDLMRYILYDCNDRFVLLEKELDFINNYLELQRIRLDDKIPVQLFVKGDASDWKIAPLLFEPLIENAFKHGSFGKMNNGFINILFNFEVEQQVELVIENSYLSDWNNETKKDSGIGIKNVIRRLELLYPEKHSLEIVEHDKLFRVLLKIDLS